MYRLIYDNNTKHFTVTATDGDSVTKLGGKNKSYISWYSFTEIKNLTTFITISWLEDLSIPEQFKKKKKKKLFPELYL